MLVCFGVCVCDLVWLYCCVCCCGCYLMAAVKFCFAVCLVIYVCCFLWDADDAGFVG